jgi:excisionase family DNA binding protein
MLTAPHHESDEAACRTLTIEEAAKILGVGRNTAYTAAKTGDLPTVKVAGRLGVPRARLAALLGETKEGNGAEPPAPIADTTPESGAPAHGSG